MGGAITVINKENLIYYINVKDKQNLHEVFKTHPSYINEALTKVRKMPPLGWAAMRGNVEMCNFILKCGA